MDKLLRNFHLLKGILFVWVLITVSLVKRIDGQVPVNMSSVPVPVTLMMAPEQGPIPVQTSGPTSYESGYSDNNLGGYSASEGYGYAPNNGQYSGGYGGIELPHALPGQHWNPLKGIYNHGYSHNPNLYEQSPEDRPGFQYNSLHEINHLNSYQNTNGISNDIRDTINPPYFVADHAGPSSPISSEYQHATYNFNPVETGRHYGKHSGSSYTPFRTIHESYNPGTTSGDQASSLYHYFKSSLENSRIPDYSSPSYNSPASQKFPVSANDGTLDSIGFSKWPQNTDAGKLSHDDLPYWWDQLKVELSKYLQREKFRENKFYSAHPESSSYPPKASFLDSVRKGFSSIASSLTKSKDDFSEPWRPVVHAFKSGSSYYHPHKSSAAFHQDDPQSIFFSHPHTDLNEIDHNAEHFYVNQNPIYKKEPISLNFKVQTIPESLIQHKQKHNLERPSLPLYPLSNSNRSKINAQLYFVKYKSPSEHVKNWGLSPLDFHRSISTHPPPPSTPTFHFLISKRTTTSSLASS